MDKVENIQEWMSNVSREKNPRVKNTFPRVTKIKISSDLSS